MQIVINIDDEDYDDITLTGENTINLGVLLDLREAVRNGKILPKGHGDLKDMGNLQYVFDLTREDIIYSGKDIERAVKSMKSIIEADRSEEE